jgi:acyl-CoA synthetase (AMP-forming)/AMP-acid ligase II
VVVDPGMSAPAMRGCLEQAEPEAFIGVAKAHAARLLLGGLAKSIRVRIGVGVSFGMADTSLDDVRRYGMKSKARPPESGPDDPAAIMFTSGSTGPPRGALYTHGNLYAQVGMVRDAFGIEHGEVDLPTFPLFALFDPALGMTTVVPDMDAARPADADPQTIARSILNHDVTTMFASPGLLDPLSRFCEEHEIVFPTLRRVITAGAPVAASIVERMAKALPEGGVLHTPYGATEALPVTTIDHGTILGETRSKSAEGAGICVGRPLEGVEVRLIRVEDGAIASWSADLEVARGAPGEICVRGPQVTRGYFRLPDADALTKIPDPAGGFWHRMGDVGAFDDGGRLWFLGRKSQRVRTAAGDLYPDQCEGVFNALPWVAGSALVGVGPPRGQRAVLCVRAAATAVPDEKERVAMLLARGDSRDLTRPIRDFLSHPNPLPVDTRHNAKIRREALAVWAAERLP